MDRIIPIIITSKTYYGMSIHQLRINVVLFCFYFCFFNIPFALYILILLIQGIINIIIVKSLAHIEENLITVFFKYYCTPNQVMGYFNSLPLQPFKKERKSEINK
jgi:hypothetical protein